MAVEIKKWGTELSGRTLGEHARAEIESRLEGSRAPDPLVIDLSGVEAMSTSFADECFGVLVRKMRSAELARTHLRFVGGSEDVRIVVRAVLTAPAGRELEHA